MPHIPHHWPCNQHHSTASHRTEPSVPLAAIAASHSLPPTCFTSTPATVGDVIQWRVTASIQPFTGIYKSVPRAQRVGLHTRVYTNAWIGVWDRTHPRSRQACCAVGRKGRCRMSCRRGVARSWFQTAGRQVGRRVGEYRGKGSLSRRRLCCVRQQPHNSPAARNDKGARLTW